MLRLHSRRALLMGAAAVTVASTPEPASSPASSAHKLPIYPKEETVLVVEAAPSRLELEIRRARLAATEQYLRAHATVRQGVERWIGLESRVESRLKSLKARDESLTPGALYAGVAALTGSVLARNRALPIRVLLPPTLLLASLPYFLPRTSANVAAYARELERAHFPQLAEQHESLEKQTRGAWTSASASVHGVGATVQDRVRWAVGETQRATGLRLREALGWAEKEGPKAVEKAENEVKGVFESAKKEGKELVESAKKEGKELVDAAKKEIEELRKSK
ncbi:hypothetical protein EXIGLDRAFT_830664 [Exidia glandulosa HHB12029]|uniref:MICOS complex subunit n=1 Tax=Exidia glandulosa HHB12029 TaxID=1314781 RepID=A0A165NBK3_EXIGL|nr:hypothetical protein EXIGLDRAFT_830664 [Exidia glandulosa HHB12029]